MGSQKGFPERVGDAEQGWNLPPPKKKNFPGMVCRVGSDSSRFLGILRDAEEEVDEETIKAGKIPPQKGGFGDKRQM